MTQRRRPRERGLVYSEPEFDAKKIVDQVLARDVNDRGGRRRSPLSMRNGEIVRSGAGVHTDQEEGGRDGTIEGGVVVYQRMEISAAAGIRADDYKSIVDHVMGTAIAPHPRRTHR